MAQTGALSSDEIRGLRADLAAGRTPTVWFTQAAVGVTQGRSGKVVSLGDLDEGDFIQVKPAGSQDVLSFSAGEVTMSRPSRQRKTSSGRGKVASSKKTSAAEGAVTSVSGRSDESGASHARAPSKASAGQSAGGHGARGRATSTKTAAAAPPAQRKTGQQPGVVITLTSTSGGQWIVDVTTGKKRVLKEAPVSASAVAHAAEALHEDVAGAVEPLLEAAREQQRARVEQLQQELAEAERALSELTDQPSRGA
ncbi:cell wall anchor protein [Allosaccharopolyspora coralli]|uniref:Cell wall anchor protein n=1 Tax=Allosaccharopolyspora coralli TaxID=2665642 RepID=A0A5Q3Q9I3_9PSEU|nr:DUF6319 family protein [Allosaccharopolyspora coralli]QGK71218.1 cell wall anchor protein [Allosaccharopolyspora coralli]